LVPKVKAKAVGFKVKAKPYFPVAQSESLAGGTERNMTYSSQQNES